MTPPGPTTIVWYQDVVTGAGSTPFAPNFDCGNAAIIDPGCGINYESPIYSDPALTTRSGTVYGRCVWLPNLVGPAGDAKTHCSYTVEFQDTFPSFDSIDIQGPTQLAPYIATLNIIGGRGTYLGATGQVVGTQTGAGAPNLFTVTFEMTLYLP